MIELRGQTAFITGAAQGVGRGIAEALLEHGVTVFITDINSDKGEATIAELQQNHGKDKVYFSRCDVTSKEQFESTFQEAIRGLGHIDIFINNAGIMHEGDDMWEKSILINFAAMVRGTKLALEHMRKDKGGKGGRIVNLGSSNSFRDSFICPVYSGTKHAIRSFTSGMALRPDVKELGVEFAVFCPDVTNTSMSANTTSESVHFFTDKLKDTLLSMALSVPYVARACLDLIRSDTMNGAVLLVTKDAITYRKMQNVEVSMQ